jgi:hypothetical protein
MLAEAISPAPPPPMTRTRPALLHSPARAAVCECGAQALADVGRRAQGAGRAMQGKGPEEVPPPVQGMGMAGEHGRAHYLKRTQGTKLNCH